MRIRSTYTNRWRLGFWAITGQLVYGAFIDPTFFSWYSEMRKREYWFQDWDKYREKEEYQWQRYLRRWSHMNDTNMLSTSLGWLSNSMVDKIMFGERKFQDPPPYERVTEEFMKLAEQCGRDPAAHFHDAIRKMVDAYYPHDLDPKPEETKRVLKPKIQWVYPTDLDDYVTDEESKPRPNSVARYLWFIPGFKDYYLGLQKEAREYEEQQLTALSPTDRQRFYETMEALQERWAMEINDYLPLLAYRWDRKLKLAQYVMDPGNAESIATDFDAPGGFKKLLVNAGVLTSEQAVGFSNRQHEY